MDVVGKSSYLLQKETNWYTVLSLSKVPSGFKSLIITTAHQGNNSPCQHTVQEAFHFDTAKGVMWTLLFRQSFDEGLGESWSTRKVTGGLEEGWRRGEGARRFETRCSSPAACPSPVHNYAQQCDFVAHHFLIPRRVQHANYLLWWQP